MNLNLCIGKQISKAKLWKTSAFLISSLVFAIVGFSPANAIILDVTGQVQGTNITFKGYGKGKTTDGKRVKFNFGRN